MNLESIPLFATMKGKLDYLSERQAILAQNIANADTPNYKAKDVQPPDFSSSLARSTKQLQMVSTNKKHISSTSIPSGNLNIIQRDSTYELSPTGNNVTIEEEMAKVAANQAEYQKTLNLYRKSVEMFKIAIGKASG